MGGWSWGKFDIDDDAGVVFAGGVTVRVVVISCGPLSLQLVMAMSRTTAIEVSTIFFMAVQILLVLNINKSWVRFSV